MAIVTFGIELAKKVLAVDAVDAAVRRLARDLSGSSY